MNAAMTTAWPEAFDWWLDELGGFRVLTMSRVRVGSVAGFDNAVRIQGDLSSHHAAWQRDEAGTILEPIAETSVNGKPAGVVRLKHGDRIRMRSVEMVHHQPVGWSTTARLEMVSGHRLTDGLDGVILLGETCLLGSGADRHLRLPRGGELCLRRCRGEYWLLTSEELSVDGETAAPGWVRIHPQAEVSGAFGSFRFTPVGGA